MLCHDSFGIYLRIIFGLMMSLVHDGVHGHWLSSFILYFLLNFLPKGFKSSIILVQASVGVLPKELSLTGSIFIGGIFSLQVKLYLRFEVAESFIIMNIHSYGCFQGSLHFCHACLLDQMPLVFFLRVICIKSTIYYFSLRYLGSGIFLVDAFFRVESFLQVFYFIF